MNSLLINNLLCFLMLCLIVNLVHATEEPFDASLEKASRLIEEKNYQALFRELMAINKFSKEADLVKAASDLAFEAAEKLDQEKPILKPSSHLYSASETLALKAARLYKTEKQKTECQTAHLQYRKASYMRYIRTPGSMHSQYDLLQKLPIEINKSDISFCN